MKTKFSVYDPLVQQALQSQGSQFVVPPMAGLPPPEAGFGVDTSQPLTPDLQAMGAAQAQQIEQERAQADQMAAMSAYEHAPQQAPASNLSLDWQPPLARIPPPDVGSQSAPQEPQEPAPQQPRPQPVVARQSAQPKSGNKARMDSSLAGIGDAIEQRQQTAEELGQARAETGRSTADLLSESTVDDAMAQQELADAQDAHIAATNKVQQEQRELTSFISNYEPKDRRTTTSRVMGAIAVGLAGMQDQNNLVAGLKQGINVQTNNAAMVNNMINTSIDRDIDLQRQMLDNKRTALAAKNSELGQMRERYGDGVESVKLARAMKIDQYQKELDSIVARGASQEAVLTAQEAKAQLEQQKQQLFFEVYGTRYQQEVRARQGMGAMGQLKIQEQQLKNARLAQELEAGPDGEKLSADERKVQRSLGAVKPAQERLLGYLNKNDLPYVGVRSGTQRIPDALVPDENLKYRNDILAVAGQALRDDSGAVLGPAELNDKLERMGVFSGSEELRKQGLKDLMYEYDSRLNRGKPSPEAELRNLTRPLSR